MCYIFPCPQHDGATELPLHSFVPQSTDREPGLILVSVYGEVRIWDSVGAGLAGGKNFTTMELNLMEDEHVTNLVQFNVSRNSFLSALGSITHIWYARPKHFLLAHLLDSFCDSYSLRLEANITLLHDPSPVLCLQTPFLDSFLHSLALQISILWLLRMHMLALLRLVNPQLQADVSFGL